MLKGRAICNQTIAGRYGAPGLSMVASPRRGAIAAPQFWLRSNFCFYFFIFLGLRRHCFYRANSGLSADHASAALTRCVPRDASAFGRDIGCARCVRRRRFGRAAPGTAVMRCQNLALQLCSASTWHCSDELEHLPSHQCAYSRPKTRTGAGRRRANTQYTRTSGTTGRALRRAHFLAYVALFLFFLFF